MLRNYTKKKELARSAEVRSTMEDDASSSMIANLKPKIFDLMENDELVMARILDIFLLILILLNVIMVVLESVSGLDDRFGTFFVEFEFFSVVVFTVEYLLRIWVCTMHDEFNGVVKGRFRYARTPMALVDLIAIAPFYLPLLFNFDLRMLRLLRLFRLMRLLKVLRYSESLRVFSDVYRMKKSELGMCFMAILFLLVMASAIIYHVEHEDQPEAFSSIPAAMWWGVATLTTVGYGDIYPITPMGKFFGAIIALLGIGLFALPAGILGSGFVVALRRKSSSKFYCPHCSEEITRES